MTHTMAKQTVCVNVSIHFPDDRRQIPKKKNANNSFDDIARLRYDKSWEQE